MNDDNFKLAPNVVMPNRDFFIGVMFGFNLARKRVEENPQPLFGDKEATNKDFYFGSWLELTCAKCGRHYIFNGPNDVLDNNLQCETEECENVIILYGVSQVNLWRIGSLTF